MSLPESVPPPRETRVWDPLVRIIHWSLVMVFAVAWLTGEDESRGHELSGYVVIGLVTLRIVWGFIGTRYARFSDFVCRPSTVMAYVRDFLMWKPKRYLGHNPLGGAMIVALLISLLAAGATGIAAQGAEEGPGFFASLATTVSGTVPNMLAKAVAEDGEGDRENEGAEELWEELHEFFANLTFLLVVLHIAGVIVSSLVHRENLVRAMFTGRKSV